MSNNKQSSVEWLISQVEDYIGLVPVDIIEKPKAMHREEIRVLYMEGAFERNRHLDGKEFTMPTDYYNETFKE